MVHLKPRHERGATIDQVMKELRPKLASIPGMKVYHQNPPTVRIGGKVTKSLYQFSMQTPDKAELYEAAEQFTRKVAEIPGVEDVTNDVPVSTPQVNLTIDRDKAAA